MYHCVFRKISHEIIVGIVVGPGSTPSNIVSQNHPLTPGKGPLVTFEGLTGCKLKKKLTHKLCRKLHFLKPSGRLRAKYKNKQECVRLKNVSLTNRSDGGKYRQTAS